MEKYVCLFLLFYFSVNQITYVLDLCIGQALSWSMSFACIEYRSDDITKKTNKNNNNNNNNNNKKLN